MQPAFNLWDEDGLLFEDHPELFVLLDRTPIIWSIRGLRLFRPRFALLGIEAKTISTRAQFEGTWSRWLAVERQLLLSKIAAAAASPRASLEAKCLDAIANLDIERAEMLVTALEDRSRDQH